MLDARPTTQLPDYPENQKLEARNHPAPSLQHLASRTVRLACLRHAASVYPEPGSNSPKITISKPQTRQLLRLPGPTLPYPYHHYPAVNVPTALTGKTYTTTSSPRCQDLPSASLGPGPRARTLRLSPLQQAAGGSCLHHPGSIRPAGSPAAHTITHHPLP